MKTLSLSRTMLVSLALVALALAVAAMQFVVRAVERGLAQSATVRVAQANVCSENSGAHFTGCSTIL